MKLARGGNKSVGRMVLRGSAWLICGRFARTLVTLVGTAILARLLTPADFGVAAVAAMILPLSIGLLEGLIDVPVNRDDELDTASLSNLIWSSEVVMIGLAALVWVTAPWLATCLNSPALSDLLRALCFGLLLQPFVTAGYGLLRRQHRFQVVALFLLVSGAVYVSIAVVLALRGFGVWSLVLGQLASLLVTAGGLSVLARIPVSPPRRIQTLVAWRAGGVAFAARLLEWLVANIDTLFASSVLGASGAGYYSRAYNFTTQLKEPFAVVDQTVRQAFLAQRNLDDAMASRATLGGLRLVVLAASFVAASVIVLREAIVALLLGPQWGAVVAPLAILSASLPARIARMYVDSFTYARGSMGHMLMRNIAILGLLGFGLWAWSGEGVTSIAFVVAAIHVVTLLFRGGTVDVAIAGSQMQRARAMAPGVLFAACIVIAVESASVAIPLGTRYGDYLLRAGLLACLGILGLMLLPREWIPMALRSRLPRLVSFFGQ